MARRRTKATSAQFKCPECGKTFSRAAALGSHRSRVHGVAGTSRSAARSRSATTRRTSATRSGRAATRNASRSRAASTRGATATRRGQASTRSAPRTRAAPTRRTTATRRGQASTGRAAASRARATPSRTPTTTARRSTTRRRDAVGGTRIDRNGLLQALFPNGLPAREEVINAAHAWLDEAERLARLK
jgi:hypothetical protein